MKTSSHDCRPARSGLQATSNNQVRVAVATSCSRVRVPSRRLLGVPCWGLMSGRQSQILLAELKEGSVPFTYRFLGLRLRLAFTKRRFQRVETSYQNHLTEQGEGHPGPNGLLEIMEDSFSTLRAEIGRIEAGQEKMKKRALPKVEELLQMHACFLNFLGGFRSLASSFGESNISSENGEEGNDCVCHLPMLNQGKETTIAIKKLIAEFAGVPLGLQMHDLRNLKVLLTEMI